ncbi:NAD(P)H-dependent flavin oxidoreductase [Eubacterium pyruvativorans]|uniref:NAD(P)H-dependent flavin oxidoreductase n=1 Tax=Eubacterium pyruvativorans TaxID=155865 RepID=UPI0023F4F666|nr:nitronate monooxygenase family protein [Eubacterium pyruvativorans]MCI5747819.1 nitronate monooxygenase family protein [Eubacterium pyruvativorans]
MKSLDKLEFPIIQGGMGVGVSLGGLAGAVAAEGGMGVISTADVGFREPDFETDPEAANERALTREIRKARKIAGGRGMIAVNAMVATTNFERMVRAAVSSGIDAVISGAGLPLNLPKCTMLKDVLIAPIVSGARAARMIMKHWQRHYNRKPDFIVVEGVLAGGHLGYREDEIRSGSAPDLDRVLKQVIEAVSGIPVFAAGGIFDGSDVRRVLDLGARGVQAATRFIATPECDASAGFKEAIIAARPEDVVILKSPVGMPGRALRSPLTRAWAAGKRTPPSRCIRCIHTCDPKTTPYCITAALRAAWRGDWEHGLFFCGANVGKVNRMETVREVMNDLKKGWCKA